MGRRGGGTTDTERDREIGRERQTDTDRQREGRERERGTGTDRERETERHSETERERERGWRWRWRGGGAGVGPWWGRGGMQLNPLVIHGGSGAMRLSVKRKRSKLNQNSLHTTMRNDLSTLVCLPSHPPPGQCWADRLSLPVASILMCQHGQEWGIYIQTGGVQRSKRGTYITIL